MNNIVSSTERVVYILFFVILLSFSPQSVSNAQGVMPMIMPPSPTITVAAGDVAIFNSQRLLEDEEYFNEIISRLEKDLANTTKAAELTLERINDSMRELK